MMLHRSEHKPGLIESPSMHDSALPSVMTGPFARRYWLFAFALLIALLIVYQPVWNGGLLWDDAAHVTRPDLRSWQGLWNIWFAPGTTQQYYPLTHTFFWLEHRSWGDSPLGYHLVNIVLHAVAAAMICMILFRLGVPFPFCSSHPNFLKCSQSVIVFSLCVTDCWSLIFHGNRRQKRRFSDLH